MANYSSIPNSPPYPPAGAAAVPNVEFAPGYPQGQASGYPQGQPQGQAPGYPQGQAPGYQGAPPKGADGKHAEEPSAPPPDFDQLPGYGNVGFEGSALPPPSYEEAVREPPDRESIPSATFITAEDAKEALTNFVADNCCYGKGPIEEITFNDLRSSSAFHYTLESFCESRSTKWKDEPFHGQPVVVTGLPPGPWDIQAQPPEMFKKGELKLEVPNTACVKPCHKCHARGFKTCHMCFGRGREKCYSCNGTGRTQTTELGEQRSTDCTFCHGSGDKMCISCHGSGQIKCSNCKGHANLRWYIQLKIEWKNHDDHHIIERTTLPSQLIKNVSGQKAFEETYPRVWPINHFPEQEINTASNTLVQQHQSKFPSERMLMQRHRVRIVPVTEVFYKYKDRDASFFVYGLEHKVYFPDYPAKCCCGCTIL